MNTAIVYVRTDSKNNIIAISSSNYLNDVSGWIQIDSGVGDKYVHADNYYLPEPIMANEDPPIPRYKLVDGTPEERSEEEIKQDRDSMPDPPEPSGDLEERVAALEQAQAEIWSAQAAAIREGVNSVE